MMDFSITYRLAVQVPEMKLNPQSLAQSFNPMVWHINPAAHVLLYLSHRITRFSCYIFDFNASNFDCIPEPLGEGFGVILASV